MTVMRRAALLLLIAGLAGFGGACTYGHQEEQSGPFQPLVFPGEARLGASAFMVIDSNYFQIGDQLERYDLDRHRVAIEVQGNLGSAPAAVRSVFSLESGRATGDAKARQNAWVTVVLFDLPSASSGVFSPPYPQDARLRLKVDGATVSELEGGIWVIGDGGQPTSMNATPLLPSLENELEPRTMVRLRARGSGAQGFQSSWTIGGISAEVAFKSACLQNPRAFAGSDAVKAGVTVGPPHASTTDAGFDAVQIVLSQPRGFQLAMATPADATRLGNGPILDITFDRVPSCNDPLSSELVKIRSLQIRSLDGSVRVARPGAGETSFDGSDFFYVHYVDPDRT